MNSKGSNVNITTFSVLLYTMTLVFMALVYVTSIKYNIPFKEITGDPALTFKAHPFTGIVSNIGVLLWAGACSILIFSYVILKDKKEHIFLLCSGLITSILLIDDLFMFHDYIFYSIGLNQYVMYGIYLVIFIAYFGFFKKTILQSPQIILLILAFGFLGSSVLLDITLENDGLQYFFEDGLKLLGITSWFLFYTNYSLKRITPFLKQ